MSRRSARFWLRPFIQVHIHLWGQGQGCHWLQPMPRRQLCKSICQPWPEDRLQMDSAEKLKTDSKQVAVCTYSKRDSLIKYGRVEPKRRAWSTWWERIDKELCPPSDERDGHTQIWKRKEEKRQEFRYDMKWWWRRRRIPSYQSRDKWTEDIQECWDDSG